MSNKITTCLLICLLEAILITAGLGCRKQDDTGSTSATDARGRSVVVDDSLGLLNASHSLALLATIEIEWDADAIGRNWVTFKSVRETVGQFLQGTKQFDLDQLKALEVRGKGGNPIRLSELATIRCVFRNTAIASTERAAGDEQ